MKPVGLAVFLAGTATAIIGIVTLHVTDEISGNWLGAVLIGAGVLVGLYGLATWRYEPLSTSGPLTITPAILKPLAIGVGLLVLSIISALVFDADSNEGPVLPVHRAGAAGGAVRRPGRHRHCLLRGRRIQGASRLTENADGGIGSSSPS